MPPRRRRSPKHDDAALALDKLISTPRQKPKSALEEFVEQHFDKLIEAAQTNYSLTEICDLLRGFNISSTTQSLKQTVTAYAKSIDQLEQVPEKLRADLPPSPPKPESAPDPAAKVSNGVATPTISSEAEQGKSTKASTKTSSASSNNSVTSQFNL